MQVNREVFFDTRSEAGGRNAIAATQPKCRDSIM
jgi:hypothetical protein